MKRNHCVFILLLFAVVFTSCKKDDMAYRNDFDRSYKSWLSFKESTGNSYRYKVESGSWTGSSWQTVITVKEGEVVKRSFVRKYIDPETNRPAVAETWTEDESSLNKHSHGASTLTLDEIYQTAKAEWLPKKENTNIYFEATNNGMISSCGYRDKDCVDDCFIGIHIEYIEAL